MKKKVLVRICLPIQDVQCDVLLPQGISVGQIIYVLVGMLEKRFGTLLVQKKPLLWLLRTGKALSPELTLMEQGIKNSDMLYLI